MDVSIFPKTSIPRTFSNVGVMRRREASIITSARKTPLKDFEKPLIKPSTSPIASTAKNAISAYGTSAARTVLNIVSILSFCKCKAHERARLAYKYYNVIYKEMQYKL